MSNKRSDLSLACRHIREEGVNIVNWACRESPITAILLKLGYVQVDSNTIRRLSDVGHSLINSVWDCCQIAFLLFFSPKNKGNLILF